MSISSNASPRYTPLAYGDHDTIDDEESTCGLQGHKETYDTDDERASFDSVPLSNETNSPREPLISRQPYLDNHEDEDDEDAEMNEPPADQIHTLPSPSRGQARLRWWPKQGTWTALLGAALISQTLWYNVVSQKSGEQGVDEAQKGTNLTQQGIDLTRAGLVLSLQVNYWAKEAEMREQYTECQESDILNNTSKCERIVLERVEAFRLDVQPNFELPTHTVTVTISPIPTATNITAPEDTQAPNPTNTNGFAIFPLFLLIDFLILMSCSCCSMGEVYRG